MDQVAGVPELTDALFRKFRSFIYDQCGINLADSKRTMLSNRLMKRLRATGHSSFGDYFRYVTGDRGGQSELTHMLDAVTTNKTDFFREPHHFDVLTGKVLPAITNRRRIHSDARFRVWSAGCSSGEEPYTLAMVLSEYFGLRWDLFSILATDISTDVLQAAYYGVYSEAVVEPVPRHMQRRYLMRGKGRQQGLYRVVPELRDRITFGRLNLMDQYYGIDERMDVVFCRNVIIYFDAETKIAVLTKLLSQLDPGGYLFIGHTETMSDISGNFVQIAPTVYQKTA